MSSFKIKMKGFFRPLVRWYKFIFCAHKRWYARSFDITNHMMQINFSTYHLHQSSFPQFKNINNGRDVVIYATGPTAAKYQPIEGAVHIGVNRAYDSAPVDFDYYFLQDYGGSTKEYIDELNNYRRGSCVKFYGIFREWARKDNNSTIPESVAIDAGALRYRLDHNPVRYCSTVLNMDIAAHALADFGSVSFAAIQFALWTNPRRLYLVGCDCSNSGYSYDTKFKNRLQVDSLISGYMQVKEFARVFYPSTEIISVNPVGLKGLFSDLEY